MLNFSCIFHPSYLTVVQLINNVFYLFKVNLLEFRRLFSQVPGSLHSKPDYENFHFFCAFFPPFSFSLLKFKTVLTSLFLVICSILPTKTWTPAFTGGEGRETRLTGNGKYSGKWYQEINYLLLFFMIKQFGKRRNSENSRDCDETKERQSTNEGCKSDLVRAQHFYSQLYWK